MQNLNDKIICEIYTKQKVNKTEEMQVIISQGIHSEGFLYRFIF